jgi:archaeosine synthase
MVYPASRYDVPVTGHWDREERAWLMKCLKEYLSRNRFSKIVAHLEGELREAVEEGGISAYGKIEYTTGGTSPRGLRELHDAVADASIGARRIEDFRRRSIRSRADFFFGEGAGDVLLAGEVHLRGHEVQDNRGKTIVHETINGTLALTLEGAKRLIDWKSDRYVVRIGDFTPKGSILAPGVTAADDQIRPGDEVIVIGERAFGVGRAKMSGWEMVRAKRGMAVEIRKLTSAPYGI